MACTTAGDQACWMKSRGRASASVVERPDVGDAGLVVAGEPVEQRVVVEPLDLVVDVVGLAGRTVRSPVARSSTAGVHQVCAVALGAPA